MLFSQNLSSRQFKISIIFQRKLLRLMSILKNWKPGIISDYICFCGLKSYSSFYLFYSFNGLFSFYYVVYYIIVIFLDMITKFIIVLFLFTSILCLPNSAPYIKAKNRPLNIAHRGLCSILPENTM